MAVLTAACSDSDSSSTSPATTVPAPAVTVSASTTPDTDPDLVSYFAQAEQIAAESAEVTEALPEPRGIESTIAFFAGANEDLQERIGRLSALDPPASVEDAPQRILELTGDLLALNERIAERLAGLETNEAYDALAADSELGIAAQNVVSGSAKVVCDELEDLAEANGIQTDLGCDS